MRRKMCLTSPDLNGIAMQVQVCVNKVVPSKGNSLEPLNTENKLDKKNGYYVN